MYFLQKFFKKFFLGDPVAIACLPLSSVRPGASSSVSEPEDIWRYPWLRGVGVRESPVISINFRCGLHTLLCPENEYEESDRKIPYLNS